MSILFAIGSFICKNKRALLPITLFFYNFTKDLRSLLDELFYNTDQFNFKNQGGVGGDGSGTVS